MKMKKINYFNQASDKILKNRIWENMNLQSFNKIARLKGQICSLNHRRENTLHLESPLEKKKAEGQTGQRAPGNGNIPFPKSQDRVKQISTAYSKKGKVLMWFRNRRIHFGASSLHKRREEISIKHTNTKKSNYQI